MNQEELFKQIHSFYEFVEQDDEVYFVDEDESDEDIDEEDEEEAFEEETIYAPFGPNGPVIRFRNYTLTEIPEDN